MAHQGEFSRLAGRILERIAGWCAGGGRGNVTPIMALLLAPLIGVLGLATETSTWFMSQRSMQHAADSAAMAAAINDNPTNNQDYNEGKAVAANYGYVNGSGDVTVTVLRAQTCPVPQQANSDCYKVTVSKNLPIRLVRLAGYQGDLAMGSGRGKTVQAVAMARPRGAVDDLCFIGLTTTGSALTSNGGGNALNWNGCSVFGNSNLSCNGNGDRGMNSGVSAGTSACGTPAISNQPVLVDPYAYLAANIPPDNCGSYSPKSDGGQKTWTVPEKKCGPLTLNDDLTINSPNSVLVIYNGDLNLAGHTIKTAPGASLTIMFSGPAGSASRTIKGSGTVNYAAPDSGPLSGIAWIQNPAVQGGSMTFAGNNPDFNITGLVYMPKTDITISGTIHFQTGGNACFGLVANSFRINGNIKIVDGANTQCAEAGVALPTVPGTTSRAALVQ